MTTTEFNNKRSEYGIEGTGLETTTTEVRTWTNKVIPAGSRVMVWFSPRKYPDRIFTQYGEFVGIAYTANAHKWLKGMRKSPGVKTLEKYSYDGIAKSVTGQRVEPDGWGVDGSPSWLLVAGVI